MLQKSSTKADQPPSQPAAVPYRAADRFQALMLAASQISWTSNAEGLVEQDLPLWRDYTGQTFAEVTGLGWLDAVHPDDREATARAWTTAQEHRSLYEVVFRIRRRDGVYCTFLVRGAPVLESDDSLREWVGYCTDITAQRRAETIAQGQVRVLELLAQGADLTTILTALTQFIESQADGVRCSILLLDVDGLHVHVGAAPSLPASFNQAIEGLLIGPHAGSCGTALFRGQPVIVTDIATDPLWDEYRHIALPHDLRACWSYPILAANGQVLGAFAMYHPAQRGPDAQEQQLVAVATHLAGIAIARVRHEEEHRLLLTQHEAARAEAEINAARVQALLAVTDDALAHLNMQDLLEALLARVREALRVDNVAILLLEPTNQELRMCAASGLEEAIADTVRVPVGKGVAGRIAATQAPLNILDLRQVEVWNPFLQEHLRSLLGVPILLDGRVLGVIHISSATTRVFSEDDTRLLQLVADRIAFAIDHARLYAEEQLARAAADTLAGEMEATLEAMTEGVAIYDAEGRLQHCNTAFRRMLDMDALPGYHNSTITERSHYYATRDALGHILPHAEWPIYRVLHGEVLSTNDPVVVQVVTQGGRDSELSISGAPLRNAAGTITGAVTVTRDVTEQHRMERRTHDALSALLAMAEALVNPPTPEDLFAQSGIMLVDSDEMGSESMLSRASAAQLVYLVRTVLDCDVVGIVSVRTSDEALIPIEIVGLAPEAERQWRIDAAHTTLAKFVNDAAELSQLRAKEMVFWDRAHSSFTRLPSYGVTTLLLAPLHIGEELIGLMGIEHHEHAHAYSEDDVILVRAVAQLATLVIERARLQRDREAAIASEALLRESNRQMSDFLSVVSHEIKTPLTSIKAAIQFAERRMKRRAPDSRGNIQFTEKEFSEVLNLLSRADLQVTIQNRMVEDLLDASRIQSGRLELRPEVVDLTQITRRLVEEQRMVWDKRVITLEDAGLAPLPVVADAMRLGQVISNYLTNALKYSVGTAPVAVQLTIRGARVRLSVRDQGPGLQPEEIPRIWERFHRVKGIAVKSGAGVGLGLGLFICKSLIERHKGRVGVDSVPGVGSTFWFEIPLMNGKDAPATH